MKNEDRVVELLAESLKRQDQMIERLEGVEKGVIDLRQDVGGLHKDNDRMIGAIHALTDIVKAWMDHTKDIGEMRERLNRLEKHVGL